MLIQGGYAAIERTYIPIVLSQSFTDLKWSRVPVAYAATISEGSDYWNRWWSEAYTVAIGHF
jgi:hypothetical protein